MMHRTITILHRHKHAKATEDKKETMPNKRTAAVVSTRVEAWVMRVKV